MSVESQCDVQLEHVYESMFIRISHQLAHRLKLTLLVENSASVRERLHGALNTLKCLEIF